VLLENYCLHLFVYDGKIKIKKIENCKKTTIKRPPQKKKKKKKIFPASGKREVA
jgi:hypothetical protein